jgi:hypothetical protein
VFSPRRFGASWRSLSLKAAFAGTKCQIGHQHLFLAFLQPGLVPVATGSSGGNFAAVSIAWNDTIQLPILIQPAR